MGKVQKGEIYKRYDGGYYEVSEIATQESTMEEHVVYFSHIDTSRQMFMCPVKVFVGELLCNGEVVKRFERML